MEDSRRTWPTEPTKQSSHGLTETEAVSRSPAWVCTRFSACMSWLLALCSCGVPSSGVRRISDFFAWIWYSFSYCVVLSILKVRAFALSYCILLCLVGCCGLLESCSFLKGTEREWIWGGGKGREMVVWDDLYEGRSYFQLKGKYLFFQNPQMSIIYHHLNLMILISWHQNMVLPVARQRVQCRIRLNQ